MSRLRRDALAVVPNAIDEFAGFGRAGDEYIAQAESALLPDGISRERNRSADLGQFLRLLVDVGLDAALAQSHRESQAADTATDDGDSKCLGHASLPPTMK
jgi:hypothetical protein